MGLFWQKMAYLPLVCALVSCGGGDSESITNTTSDSCSVDNQKVWTRAHLDDVYLWYNEIINVPKENYATPESYFDALLVKSKDRFSFVANTAEINNFQNAGLDIGYGISWVNDPLHGDSVRVAFVEENSPAAKQGLERGHILQKIDGKSLNNFSQAAFVEALYPQKIGVQHSFEVTPVVNPKTIVVTLTAQEIVQNPVPIARTLTVDNKKIGYLLFNDHNRPASEKLVAAMNSFKAQNIDELLIDLRYNSGGFLYVAAELASMIAGSKVQNQIFSSFIYNDKHRNQGGNYYFTPVDSQGNTLPQLNLPRVFVLTGKQTCSASESLIGALSPFLDVVLIGSASSCGKPYGFLQADHCDSTYFAIRYYTANAFGQSTPVKGYKPRCQVNDNLSFALGTSEEVMFNTSVSYMATGLCPTWSNNISQTKTLAVPSTSAHTVYHAPWRSNMMIERY